VGGAHVAVGLLIAQGLGVRIPMLQAAKPIDTQIIDEARPLDPTPAIPDGVKSLEPPTIIDPAPLPEPQDTTPPVDPSTAVTVPPATGGGGAVATTPAPVLTRVRSDPNHPISQPPYPPVSIRLGQQGPVVVSVWVLPNGRVGDVRLDASSGFDALDRAAMSEARRWRLVPATRDGIAIPQWYAVRVVLNLQER